MKKSLYLKLSQQETNKKLQLLLVERYNLIKKKNVLLGWLYFIYAYIVYSLVAIVSFVYRLAMLPSDFRFTPHYMQTVIDHNNMDAEQANEYLNTQLKDYQKSKSYGNFSLAQRDTINTTFELLLEKYKLPEPQDNKHLAIMSGLSKIENLSLEQNQNILELNSDIKEVSVELSTQITDKNTIIQKQLTNIEQIATDSNSTTKESVSALSEQISESANALLEQNNTIKDEIINISQSADNIRDSIANVTDKIEILSSQQINSFSGTQEKLDNINSNIGLVKSTIEPVVSYTKQKQQEEKLEKEHIKELRESQEKRQTTAYNREKGKKLNSFESALSNKQIDILVKYCNRIAVFDRDIEFSEMKDILLCAHQKPFKLTVNKYLALLFSELSDNKLICKTWKSVATRYECFVSAKDKTLVSNDFYMANQTSGLIDQKVYSLIEECIEKIISVSNR